MNTESTQSKLEQLGFQLDYDNIPYRLDKMFPKTEGWGAKGDMKRKAKLLNQIQPILPQILNENEEVFYIAKGVQHSILEGMTIGAVWSSLINQTVFVLTNVRLLIFRTNTRGRPTETCWSIYYSEITTFKKKLLSGVVTVKLADGKSLQFTGFSKLDRTTMPEIFEETLQLFRELDFRPQCSQSREDMCGRCFQLVPKGQFDCPGCQTKFWKPSEVAIRSLAFPAWGDFLLKHHLLAIVELIGLAMTWLIAIILAFQSDVVGALILVVFAHSFDAIVTYFIARKGLHPKPRAKNQS